MDHSNKESLKFLIVGWWHHEFYEDAFRKALLSRGFSVDRLSCALLFKYLSFRIERAIPIPLIATIFFNIYFLLIVILSKPKYILLWRVTHLMPVVVRVARHRGHIILTYNNDDPFSPLFRKTKLAKENLHWRWYRRILFLSHINFFYRPVNVEEANGLGLTNARLLMPYFLPWRDKPMSESQAENNVVSDVVFVGHFEEDQRLEYIKYLANSKINITVYGPKDWIKPLETEGISNVYRGEVTGNDYVKTINSAKICLCFLSKINRDEYTRRCFEIPACGTLLLSERTPFLVNIYGEGKGAYFFSDKIELLSAVNKLLGDEFLLEAIADIGLKTVWEKGFSIDQIVGKFINEIEQY